MNSRGPDVSRETHERLNAFSDLVQKWTKKINLISKASIQEIHDRHISDSAQIFRHAPECKHWVDIGSGGGFPGIVVAILASAERPDQNTVLVESDTRKAIFLRTAIRELELNAKVLARRIEDIEPLNADILSARALASLSQLLGYCDLHLSDYGTALFLKGAKWESEHKAARSLWSYRCDVLTSETDQTAAILRIKDVKRV